MLHASRGRYWGSTTVAVRSPVPSPSAAGDRSASGLLAPAPRQPGRSRRQRHPSGYDACALPRLHVVGDGGEQPAQLDGGRQLAPLIEHGADRGGFRFGDDDHPMSMVVWAVTGKQYRRQMCSVYHVLATAAPIMPRCLCQRECPHASRDARRLEPECWLQIYRHANSVVDLSTSEKFNFV